MRQRKKKSSFEAIIKAVEAKLAENVQNIPTPTDNAGVLQWAIDVVAGSQRDVGKDIAVDINGNFYIVGRTTQSIPNEDKVVSTWVRKFNQINNQAQEDQNWTRKFPAIRSSSTQVNTYNSVETDSAGNVYLTEFQNQATGRDFSLIHKYNSAGNLIWKTPALSA